MLARRLISRKVPATIQKRTKASVSSSSSRTMSSNAAIIQDTESTIPPLVIHGGEPIGTLGLKRTIRAPNGWPKRIVSSSTSSTPSSSSSSSFSSAGQMIDRGDDDDDDDDGEDNTTNSSKLDTEGMEAFEKMEVDMEELKNLASMRCTALSLKDMYKYAVDFSNQEQRLRNAQFLHKELPIRIAQRAVDLLNLPHGLSQAHPIQQIAHMYLQYLQRFQEFPVPTTPEEEHAFTDLLQQIVVNRSSIPKAIARGLDVWRKSLGPEELENVTQQMEEALYRFFTARVGLRFLTEHHILTSPHHAKRSLLRKSHPTMNERDDILGCIQTDCDPVREIENVVDTVTLHTQELFGVCPEIQIVDASREQHAKFTYVPHHLQYMVGELIKNSCRATVKR